MEQFQEYLLWKPFIVNTNNKPLMYIMTTPNLDATQCTLALSTKRDRIMQLQIPWAELHQGWMQKKWSPTWTESLWDWQEEKMSMTHWWWKLMKRSISRSRKLPSKLELIIHVWTYRWLIGWLLNGKIQYLRPQSIRSPIGKYRIRSIFWEMTQTLRREWPSFKSGKS